MMLLSRNGNSLPGFVLVAAAHLFLFYLVLQDHSRGKPVQASRYSRLLFITVPRKPAVAETPSRRTPPAGNKRVAPSISAVENLPAPADIAAAPMPIENTAPADNADPFDPSARLDIDNLVSQAGRADRETRSAREMQGYGPTRQSIEAIMTRAFTEAKLAVPLKWYEAARIELFSAPNDPKKIYQVKTAFGTYCLFYPSIHEDSGGQASARQPTVGSCPRRFGQGAR